MAQKSNSQKKSDASSSSSASNSKVGKTQVFLTTIVVLLVINLVFTLTLVFTGDAASNQKIENIDAKVNAMDEFFSNYVDGYVSPSGSGSAQAGGDSYGNDNEGSVGTGSAGNVLEVDIEGEPSKGDSNAPVVMVEFSDYECPFCGRFYSQTYHQLVEEYVDTGKVRFVFKDFPLSFHPQAEIAAVAANCVQKELGDDKYFEYHDILFERQTQLSASNLVAWAQEVGVDTSTFETCLEDPSMAAEVQGDLQEGAQLGVSGTPSFIINGELVVGAQPYSVIKQVIESKLS